MWSLNSTFATTKKTNIVYQTILVLIQLDKGFLWILLFALIYLNLNSEEHHKSYGFESDENESINRLLYLVLK